MTGHLGTLEECVEKAARAICADVNQDPDQLKEWGPCVGGSSFRENEPREAWKNVASNLELRQQFIALEAIGVVRFKPQR